jgi:hypothetical protein
VRRRLAIRLAGPPDEYLALVRSLPVSQGVEIGEGELVVLLDDLDRDTPLVVRALVEAGALIQRVAGLDSALEAAYLSIIGGEQPSIRGAES